MNILITGGCGFIGTNLISVMTQQKKYNIRVLDNESLGMYKNIEQFGVDFIHGDITDFETVNKSMNGIDAVVHLAADTRVIDSINDPLHNFNINMIGTMNILMAMKENKVNKIINASTGGAILGEVPPPVHEDMLPAPQSPYGASKLAIEGYLGAFAASYSMKTCSLRFSNVYGPNSRHKGSVVAAFIRQILAKKNLTVYGDGQQLRDYVYIDDLCQGILQVIQNDIVGVYQLGTGIPTSINKLIEILKNTVGEKYEIKVDYLPYRTGELQKTWCDISKARKAFNYNPTMSLEQGIENTWKWFLAENNCQ